MGQSAVNFREYIFEASHDRERLVLQHEINKPSVSRIMERVLDEYGLAERLQTAKTNGTKLRVLDVGCGEGLFLHDLAELLETRGLLDAATLIGIDIDMAAIDTAHEFRVLTKPPRPYLNFYVHDVTRPLEECPELRSVEDGQTQFDFIFAIFVTEHLPEARQQVEKLYHALKPGGIIYLRDFLLDEGENGWTSVHPAITPLNRAYCNYLLNLNKGTIVAREQANWLKEVGASQVQALPDLLLVRGDTEFGRKQLRNVVMITRNSGPQLISRGAMTQAEFEQLMNLLFQELGPHSRGQVTHIDTLARKEQFSVVS